MRAAAGLIAGIILGSLVEISVTGGAAEVLAVMLLAAADAVVGGFCAKLRAEFSDTKLLGGFFVNVIFAAALLALGKFFGVEMYLVALVAFGLRIFKNLAALKNRLFF